jgi:hypothetical protein
MTAGNTTTRELRRAGRFLAAARRRAAQHLRRPGEKRLANFHWAAEEYAEALADLVEAAESETGRAQALSRGGRIIWAAAE